MKRICVIDLFESYETSVHGELRETICMVGRNELNKLCYVYVDKIPNECYIAIGKDVSEEKLASNMSLLNRYCIQNMGFCRQTGCERCKPKAFGINRDACGYEKKRGVHEAVKRYEVVQRRGFHRHEKHSRTFVRVEFTHASFIALAEKWAYDNERLFGTLPCPGDFGAYEIRPKPVDSFLILADISSFTWVEYTPNQVNENKHYVHFSDLLVIREPKSELVSTLFSSDSTNPEYVMQIPPLLASSPDQVVPATVTLTHFYFDIEVISVKYTDSKTEQTAYPVGAISTIVEPGGKRCSFMFGPNPVPSTSYPVHTFTTEVDMLSAFYDYVMETDPDVFIGYNSNNYDFPYLLKRAKLLGIRKFPYMSRVANQPMLMHKQETYTGQNKTLVKTTLDCPGRICFDLYPMMRQLIKLSAYKLSDVAEHYKLQNKDDLHYSELYSHFHGGVEKRAKLEHYCMRDVELCVEIQVKSNAIRQWIAKCIVLRLRGRDVLDRGLGYCNSMLVGRTYREMGYVNKRTPSKLDEETGKFVKQLDEQFRQIEGYEDLWDMKERHEKYPGAFVFEPLTGLYEDIVFTLDFNSLYPSIIRTNNICRSTQMANIYEDPDANISPCKPTPFAYTKRKEGVFPRVERMLMTSRAEVRKRMKAFDKDSEEYKAMDAEQNQRKLAANALYGLLGTTTSEISLISGAFSVTAWGAQYIHQVCDHLKAEYPSIVKPIYGDTDSLFLVLLNERNKANGRKQAIFFQNLVNKQMKKILMEDSHLPEHHIVLKMEAENLSCPTLLIAKKKYIKCLIPIDENDKDANVLKLKKSGLETRASCKYTLAAMNDLLQAALIQGIPQAELIKRTRGWLAPLHAGNIPRARYLEFKLSSNLSKAVESYASDDAHLVAARQMLHDELPVECGDRIEYYMCHVNQGVKQAKSDLAVSAHLIEQHTLHWPFYIEQLEKMMENCIAPLIHVPFYQVLQHSSYTRISNQVLKSMPPRAQSFSPHAFAPQKRTAEDAFAASFSIPTPRVERAPTYIPGMTQTLLPGASPVYVTNTSAAHQKKLKQDASKAKRQKKKESDMSAAKAMSMFISLGKSPDQ